MRRLRWAGRSGVITVSLVVGIAGGAAILASLAHGQAALGSTWSSLTGLGTGSVLRFGPRSVTVAGILPDAAIGATEVFVSDATARALGVQRERYLIVAPRDGSPRQR